MTADPDTGWYGRGDWLPAAGEEGAGIETPELAGYTCGPCQSGKHERCRDFSCNCCAGGDDNR